MPPPRNAHLETGNKLLHKKSRQDFIKKNAFTLAEVLITLGIIGIVAALTIPALVGNYRKKVVETKLKKFYSIMSQALTMSEIENGPAKDWPTGFNDYAESLDYYNTYWKKYLNKLETKKTVQGDKTIIVYLSDGSAFKLSNGACADFHYYLNESKIKEASNSNIAGKDYFSFRICKEGSDYYAGGKNGVFATAVNGPLANRLDRNFLLEHCKTPFEDGNTCSALIEYDGWQIKDDYPYKF